MLVPETRYARSGEVSIAYQVFGRGDVDLVVLSTFWNQIEHHWELPSFARALGRLGSFARVVMLDKRGSGLSDRVTGTPSAEERMEDIHAVMDAVGVDRPALLGASEGTLSALFAATYPQQTEALIIYGSSACWADSISETDLAPSMPTLTTAGEAATSLGSSRRLWLTTRALGAGSLGLSA